MWMAHASDTGPHTQHASLIAFHGVVAKVILVLVIVLQVVGLVGHLVGPAFGLQQQVGSRRTHDVHLEGALFPHHLSIVHSEVGCTP